MKSKNILVESIWIKQMKILMAACIFSIFICNVALANSYTMHTINNQACDDDECNEDDTKNQPKVDAVCVDSVRAAVDHMQANKIKFDYEYSVLSTEAETMRRNAESINDPNYFNMFMTRAGEMLQKSVRLSMEYHAVMKKDKKNTNEYARACLNRTVDEKERAFLNRVIKSTEN